MLSILQKIEKVQLAGDFPPDAWEFSAMNSSADALPRVTNFVGQIGHSPAAIHQSLAGFDGENVLAAVVHGCNVGLRLWIKRQLEQSSRKKVPKVAICMSNESLPHRLVSFRERHGLTQTDLAEMLGVTARYVSGMETGLRDIDPSSSLYRLFKAYEGGQIPVRNGTAVGEHAVSYKVETARSDSIGTGAKIGDLSAHDVLSQIRADLSVIESGHMPDKRRAYHFMREVHLPMLAKMMKLE